MIHTYDIAILDRILSNGLCHGAGDGTSTFCAEQAVAALCGLPVTDHPDEYVTPDVSAYGRRLNDARWADEKTRAAGMRDFLLAQIGSKGIVEGQDFARRMALQTVKRVLPLWLRNAKMNEALVVACENATDLESARVAARAAEDEAWKLRAAFDAAAYAYASAAYAAYASAASAAYASDAAAYAAYSAVDAAASAAAAAAYASADAAVCAKALPLSAQIAVEILRELKSPGCELIDGERAIAKDGVA